MTAEDVARNFWSALRGNDVGRAIALLADDAVFHAAGLPPANGRAAVEMYLTATHDELGSPLGTIAVAARELERSLAQRESDASLQDDARLIRAQVDRCRHILDELASNAGGPPGAASDDVPLAEFVARAIDRFPDKARVLVTLPNPAPKLRVPRLAVEKALGSLVHNALLATSGGAVRLIARRRAEELALIVEDDGLGMPPEVLEHATEPFFSTREAGAGRGLGLFLATSVVDQLGGRLELESHPGKGTRAALVLPSSTVCDDLSHSRAADAA